MKKILALILALVMVFSMTSIALAVDDPIPQESGTATGDGHTTIGIVSTAQKIEVDEDGNITGSQITFEVPLYIIMAVGDNSNYVANSYTLASNGASGVITPKNYGIKNSGQAAIGVKSLNFGGYTGGRADTGTNTWSTMFTGTPSAAKQIKLSIGGQILPTIAAGGAAKTVTGTGTTELLFNTGSAFVTTGSNPAPIAAGASLDLPILAAAGKASFTEQAAAPQFQLVYTMGFTGGTGPNWDDKFVSAADVYTYVGSQEAQAFRTNP